MGFFAVMTSSSSKNQLRVVQVSEIRKDKENAGLCLFISYFTLKQVQFVFSKTTKTRTKFAIHNM